MQNYLFFVLLLGLGIEPHALAQTTWRKAAVEDGSWTQMVGSKNGALIFAATADGMLWKSSDGGETWSVALKLQPADWWRALAADASGARVLAVAPSRGIFASRDEGNTWTKSGPELAPGVFWQGIACSADGMQMMAASAGEQIPNRGTLEGEIWMSQDGGGTWSRSSAGAERWRAIACAEDGATWIASTTWGEPLISRDFGATWSRSDLERESWISLAVSGDGKTMYAACGDGYRSLNGYFKTGAGRIAKSSDGGRTWNETGAPDRNWDRVVCSRDGGWLFGLCSWPHEDLDPATKLDCLYYSMNGGVDWRAAALPTGVNAMASIAEGSRAVAAVYGGSIYLSPEAPALRVALVPEPQTPGNSVDRSNGSLRIDWDALPGATYLLQSTEHLNLPVWHEVRLESPGTAAFSRREARQFFRLLQLP